MTNPQRMISPHTTKHPPGDAGIAPACPCCSTATVRLPDPVGNSQLSSPRTFKRAWGWLDQAQSPPKANTGSQPHHPAASGYTPRSQHDRTPKLLRGFYADRGGPRGAVGFGLPGQPGIRGGSNRPLPSLGRQESPGGRGRRLPMAKREHREEDRTLPVVKLSLIFRGTLKM